MDEYFNKRLDNEIAHLSKLKAVLDEDVVLPLRMEIERQSLEYRRFKLTITGIQSLMNNPTFHPSPVARTFVLTVQIPPGYPWIEMPDIRFEQPTIPFHPHVYPYNGVISWGDAGPQPDLDLADWVYRVVEYLQYNQDEGSHLRINLNDPANSAARDWYVQNRRCISDYVPPIDMAYLRSCIDRLRS